jgi:protocatechuate 3,4-dioxygenase beta subunit
VGALGTFSAALAAGCGGSSPTESSTSAASAGSTNGTSSASCVVTPSETAGPYPDRFGMIGNMAFHRRDIREGRAGLPLTLTLTVANVNGGCNPIAGALVEIWQCDSAGRYSEYPQPGYDGTGQTFLRGVQTTDASGSVTFTTIYPGWYAGRATHIHVNVYANGRLVKTTQIAFPEDVSAEVYASGVYASRGQNSTRNSSDNVFSDGVQYELASVVGSAASGHTATLTVVVAA